jgi:hypothetical protein
VPGETEQKFSRPGLAHSDAAISRQTRSRSSDDLRPGNRSAAVTFAFAWRRTIAAHVRSPARPARYHPPTAFSSSDLMTVIVCDSHASDEVPQIARSGQPLDHRRPKPRRSHDEDALTEHLAPLTSYNAALGRSCPTPASTDCTSTSRPWALDRPPHQGAEITMTVHDSRNRRSPLLPAPHPLAALNHVSVFAGRQGKNGLNGP